jgi:hypothetical protein
VQRSIAVETGRGWRIAKEEASHKIDVVVALALAALAAVEGIAHESRWLLMARADRRRRAAPETAAAARAAEGPIRGFADVYSPTVSDNAASRPPSGSRPSRRPPRRSAPAARLRFAPSCCARPAATGV